MKPTTHRLMNSRWQALSGALAGFAATIPMSVAMTRMYHQLPPAEQYPLPPNQIVGKVVEEDHEPAHQIVTFLGHFAYGSGAGAVYQLLLGRFPLPGVVKGLIFGLTVWFVSYQGWLPAFRILPPATQQPPRRNILMIVAHVIWGGTLALLSGAILNTSKREHKR